MSSGSFSKGVSISKAIVLGQRVEHVEVIDVAPVPAAYGALGQAELRVCDHDALGIEELLHAQTVAAGAGTGRIVEGKQPRLQFGDAVAALRAGKAGGKQQFLIAGLVHPGNPAPGRRPAAARFRRIRPGAARIVGRTLKRSTTDFDAVFLLQVQFGRLIEFDHDAVDARAHEALRAQLLEDVQVLALARPAPPAPAASAGCPRAGPAPGPPSG